MLAGTNPFQELYVSAEETDASTYSQVFSPIILVKNLDIFQAKNVVLRGSQGCGKSMLLSLLRANVRRAYFDTEKEFPVPDPYRKFISGGINFARCGITDFSQRQFDDDKEVDVLRRALFLGDFINYWIVRDLIQEILAIVKFPPALIEQTGVSPDLALLKNSLDDCFPRECWFGYVSRQSSIAEYLSKLTLRLQHYRSFFMHNVKQLDHEILGSCTQIGEPISQLAKSLRHCGVLLKGAQCFVRLDQYEALADISVRGVSSELTYFHYVNKVLASRDSSVFFKVGSRRWVFNSEKERGLYGSKAVLEEGRNFHVVDIEDRLRNREYRRSGAFEEFAADVFNRRIKMLGYGDVIGQNGVNQFVVGKRLTVARKAELYAGQDPSKVLSIDFDCPAEVQELLISIAQRNPISAKLGEAWVRQALFGVGEKALPIAGVTPWEGDRFKWWRKERFQQAAMQIAAQRRQKMIWAYAKDLYDLSGYNVFFFIRYCQAMWRSWQLDGSADMFSSVIPSIEDIYIQNSAFHEVSHDLFRGIAGDSKGDRRQRAIKAIGENLRKGLLEDKQMSYPGANGISLDLVDLSNNQDISNILEDAVGRGMLIQQPHTAKSGAKWHRSKFYIHPSLSPYFQLPSAKTKEPKYLKCSVLRQWFRSNSVL